MTTEVQAPQFTEARRRSDTENARTVAAHKGWRFDDEDQVVDLTGRVISYTIEDAAAAMVALKWITSYRRTDWTVIPNDSADAAKALRKLMEPDPQGRAIYPPRWTP